MSATMADASTLRQRKGVAEADAKGDDIPPTLEKELSTVTGSGFAWLDSVLDYFGIKLTQQKKKDRKKGLGTAKYHASSILSIETLWLFTLAITGEAFANVLVPKFLEITGSGNNIEAWLPDKVDAVMVVLNITGAFLEGVGEYSSRVLVNLTDLPLLLLFRGGFCSVYTTFAGIVENGAFLDSTPVAGLVYLLCMIIAGVLANELGRCCISVLTYVENKQAPTELMVMDTEWDDRLFMFCGASIVLSFVMCYMGYSQYPIEQLFWGVAWVPIACLMGTWVETAGWRRWLQTHEDDHEEVFQGVQWGTWRCNSAAGVALVLAYVVQGYYPFLSSSHCWLKFLGTFLGAMSAFNGTTTDTVLLWRAKKRMAAINNALVNFLFLGAMLVVLNYIAFHYFPPPENVDWERHTYGPNYHHHEWYVVRVAAVARLYAIQAWETVRAAIGMSVSR